MKDSYNIIFLDVMCSFISGSSTQITTYAAFESFLQSHGAIPASGFYYFSDSYTTQNEMNIIYNIYYLYNSSGTAIAFDAGATKATQMSVAKSTFYMPSATTVTMTDTVKPITVVIE